MKNLLFLSFILFLCVASLLDAQMLTRTKVAMGTYMSISLEASKKQVFIPAFDIVNAVDGSLSSYKQNSPIFKLNRDKKVKLDAYSLEALRLGEYYYAQTDGYFNVAIGSITKDLYHFGEDERVPSEEALKRSDVNISALQIKNGIATIANDMKIDLGGMGKGFCVDKVSEYLRKQGIKKARVAASGDIRCISRCRIDVQNPFGEKPLYSFKTKYADMGISTSGNYNRYVGTTKDNHLINPKQKHSQREFVSITLISKLPNSDLDAYATAASVMPKAKALEFLGSLNAAYILLTTKGELLISKNIAAFSE